MNARRIALLQGQSAGMVQRAAPGVACDLPGDVQDAVAKPLGFAGLVLAVEGELLCPDEQIVAGERELKPRGVGGERGEGEV